LLVETILTRGQEDRERELMCRKVPKPGAGVNSLFCIR